MNICIINGSPKGKYSVTLQTLLYLQKRYPGHTYSILNAGQTIRALEKDMGKARLMLQGAELIVFSYPIYTFLAPFQLHRFIELVKQEGIDLSGKYMTQITTSKHFFDMTAHRYIEDNCHDLGMKVILGLSADMDDLLTEQGQKDADRFFAYVLHCMEQGLQEPTSCRQERIQLPYHPSSKQPAIKQSGKDIVLITDVEEGDHDLKAMIQDFVRLYPYPIRVVNIRTFAFDGGCLGCFRCAGDGTCIYKDGFDQFLRKEIQCADAIVYAFTIKDHSMGSRFKLYDDRQFCNGHRTVTEGKPIAYLIHGDLTQEENLRTVIEARAEVGHNFLCGMATDASSMESTIGRLEYAMEHHYVQPRNFYGVGGMKIFRDLIWMMRGLMKADHQFYKQHGIYDFPQKHRMKMIKMCMLGSMVRNPKIQKKMGNRMNEGMVAPYRKIIDKAHTI